jgi:hypothetical protein
MSSTRFQRGLDSIRRLHELLGVVHSCESTGWVSARTSAQHVLVGERLRCRSRNRSARCESRRLRAETSQPFSFRRAGMERGHTVGLSVSGRAPALDKGWSQGSSDRASKTGSPPRFKTCESWVPVRWGSRVTLSVLPRFYRSASVLVRSWRRLAPLQGQVDGTCRSRGGSLFLPPRISSSSSSSSIHSALRGACA